MDRPEGFNYLPEAWRAYIASLESVREEALAWLDNNTTYFDVQPPAVNAPNVPVLAAVSKRIWYHATDDQLSYPFSDVIRAALQHAPR